MVLYSYGTDIFILREGRSRRVRADNPLGVLNALLDENTMEDLDPGFSSPGAVGFFGYGLRHFFERLPNRASGDLGLPDMYFAFYDRVLCLDHRSQSLELVEIQPRIATGKHPTEPQQGIMSKPMQVATLTPGLTSNFTEGSYLEAIKKAKQYIVAGDIFQVNLSQRFHISTGFSPLEIYWNLERLNPSPYSCLIKFGNYAIISSSPELFLLRQGKQILTRPIKGTRPRGNTPEQDKLLKKELYLSPKDNAELAMIVDLERNDLGKVCEYGSVKVISASKVETYSTLHHLVATIEGKLREGINNIDVLRATFPGGSVTGAPKIRAMQIIDELEPTQRSVYTGAIGLIKFDGDMFLSMAIRILLLQGRDAFFQTGGAIVADSDPRAEYQETLVKAKGMIAALDPGIPISLPY
jgi:para-aminobenzoate synthetase component 1